MKIFESLLIYRKVDLQSCEMKLAGHGFIRLDSYPICHRVTVIVGLKEDGLPHTHPQQFYFIISHLTCPPAFPHRRLAKHTNKICLHVVSLITLLLKKGLIFGKFYFKNISSNRNFRISKACFSPAQKHNVNINSQRLTIGKH